MIGASREQPIWPIPVPAFGTPPVLVTDRLRLRPLRADDAADIFAIFSDSGVMEYWNKLPMLQLEEARCYLREMDDTRGEHLDWAFGSPGVNRRWAHERAHDSLAFGLLARVRENRTATAGSGRLELP